MTPHDWVWLFLEGTPILRRFWRWILCRKMEVIVTPYDFTGGDEATYSVAVNPQWVRVWALLNLRIINHSDKPERILGCSVHLRKRHLFLWQRTLGEVNVQKRLDDSPLDNLLLEPCTSHDEVIRIDGGFRHTGFPRHSELILVFKMVGQMRKYELKLEDIIHNPKGHELAPQSE